MITDVLPRFLVKHSEYVKARLVHIIQTELIGSD